MGSLPDPNKLVIVKSREFTRGMLAEAQNDRAAATLHFLAAAHLELVLAEDYRAVGEQYKIARSLISTASCFWRGEQPGKCERDFAQTEKEFPREAVTVQELPQELLRDYPPRAA